MTFRGETSHVRSKTRQNIDTEIMAAKAAAIAFNNLHVE